jgi:hypothetical protein
MLNSSSTTLYSVLVKSLGGADVASAATVAKGLGLSASEVVQCLYKAPAILVDRVEESIAVHLSQLLRQIGFDVDPVPCNEIPQLPQELFDVAIYLKQVDRLPDAVERFSKFTGMATADALKMLMQPPGLALGSVSRATVDAFITAMGDSVDVSYVDQNRGLYDVFLAECPAVVKKRLLDDFMAAGIEVLGDKGLIATGIQRQSLNTLWQRHKTNAALRIVHQAFLRFDLMLLPNDLPLNESQKLSLSRIADIPVEYVDQVINSAPIALMESLSGDTIGPVLQELMAVDLPVQADLITFQVLGLRINSCTNLEAVNHLLQHFEISQKLGQGLERLPATLAGVFPEIQARILHSALSNAGAEVEYIRV